MAQQISADVVIDGKKISPFSSLSLTQQFNDHHYFELRFNHDVLEELHSVTINKSQQYLGKPITITLNTLNKSGADHVFKGIVTDISMSNNLSSSGDLVFSGYSPTILLETGESNQSFIDSTLKQVASETTTGIASNDLATKISPQDATAKIPFVVQYRESNFNFLRRLSAEYGEWFFYDGTTLNLGKPAKQDTTNLSYPADIEDYNLKVRIAPTNFEQISYLSKENKELVKDGFPLTVKGLDNFGKGAVSVSKKTYSVKTSTLSRRKFTEAKQLDEAVEVAKATNAARLVTLQATSTSPFVKIGSVVNVSSKTTESKTTTDIGKFTVLSVTHNLDGLGNYQNDFEAIPSTIEIVPNEYYAKPHAEPQLAIVTDNADPDKLGRVKVRLLWQKDKTTPFIRVMTPHAGDGGTGLKNRGFHFTPEIDDTVIIGFTQNDPDRPFVMGSIPHGKAILLDNKHTDTLEGKDVSDNKVKVIRTRGGSTIYFFDDDDKKTQEVRIALDKGNYISVLTESSKGTISIYSTKALDVQSTETVNVKSKNITIEATDSIVLKANKAIELKAADIKIEGSKSFAAKGTTSATLEGTKVEIKGTATAKIAAPKLDVEGAAMTTIKGALVKIN